MHTAEMDSGLLYGWALQVATISFAASVLAHAFIGRILWWSLLAAAFIPATILVAMEVTLPQSRELWLVIGAMAAIGLTVGLVSALAGAFLGVLARNIAGAFRR